jgi:two-component system, LytTR family, response regulator
MKPYSEERLAEAVNKVKEKLNSHSRVITSDLPSKTDGGYLERIVVKDAQKIFIIPVEKVKYLEAQDDYVMIYSSEGKYLKQKTMKFYEENLSPKEFIRIHRSYIINIKEIDQILLYEKDSYQVKLRDKKILPISKTGYEKLKQILL